MGAQNSWKYKDMSNLVVTIDFQIDIASITSRVLKTGNPI